MPRIATVHLIEPNAEGVSTLYEVGVQITAEIDEGLAEGEFWAYRHTLGHCRELIFLFQTMSPDDLEEPEEES